MANDRSLWQDCPNVRQGGGRVRISELSRQSGVSVPTIKFYLREGLLPAGLPTGRNQADYSERHLRRIRLIRTLTGIAGLDLSSVREILAAIDDEDLTLRDAYQVLDQALYLDGSETLGREAVDCAREEVADLAEALGWSRESSLSGGEVLAHVLAGLRSLGCEAEVSFFTSYARAAEQLVVSELDLVAAEGGTEKGPAIVRSVLFGVALSALRRMAHEHHVALRFPLNTVE
ncbi:MerR family transcriptional regulator [Micromonospora echinofusca]|uniref:MerR family transcriptional regulator n=1 Tax=Micromonospora TaxID=1873 RepID=UPI0024C2A66B|nr:MerR family transcriptional regulator [Micromonospora sp. MSM11]